MKCRLAILWGLVFYWLVLNAGAVWAVTPKEVDDAVTKAKQYLYAAQNKDGNWEVVQQRDPTKLLSNPEGTQWGGLTAVAVYALMASGDDPEEPHVKAGLAWLKNADIVGTYAMGVRCMVWDLWTMYDPKNKEIRQYIDRDGMLLLNSIKTEGEARGLFDYYLNVDGNGKAWVAGYCWDHSVSQYGVLGLRACAENGFEVSDKYWRVMEEVWIRQQDASGGWFYCIDPPPANNNKGPLPSHRDITVTMTAAGTATLFIIQDMLQGFGSDCRGNLSNPHIDAGLNWIAANFAKVFQPSNGGTWVNYGLYGVERIGAAAGYKYFGTVDWFKEGADYLCKSQGANGTWAGGGLNVPNMANISNAAFAIVFLERGRAPVMLNKLQYDIDTHGDTHKDAHWNQRPRDAANLAKWFGRASEGFFNWQIVNLKVPSEELHDSPILYVAGDQPLDLTDEDVIKLRQFCEDGGLIVVNADCTAHAAWFVRSITDPKKLASRMFPDYEFGKLPQDHLIYKNQFRLDRAGRRIDIQALSNGVRELILVFPSSDPARFWQSGAYHGHEDAHEIMANIYLYVTDKRKPLKKDETYIVTPDPKVTTTQLLKVARLQYAGNWNPEPGGWRRIAAVVHNQDQLALACQTVALGDGKLTQDYKIAHVTGTDRFHLTAAERQEILNYINGGGTLIIDAAGGSIPFTQSAQDELQQIFGDAAKQLQNPPLPPDDPLYTAKPGPIADFSYRALAVRQLTGHAKAPRLRAIQINHRNAVYFSAEDLSAGMVGEEMDGIYGYTPATATAIMEHLLVQTASPAPAAAAK